MQFKTGLHVRAGDGSLTQQDYVEDKTLLDVVARGMLQVITCRNIIHS